MKDKKVLVIDDVADQAYLAKKILENVGLSVTTADSVDAAIDQLQLESPHLIVLDLQMPGKSGYKLLEYRRTAPLLADVPILVVSGLDDQQSIFRAITLGADDYLIKPYHAAKLLQKARKHLKDSQFQSLDFAPDFQPSISMAAPAEVTQIQSATITFESAARIAPRTRLEFLGETLDFLKEGSGIYLSLDRHSTKAKSGRYETTVTVAGLSQSLSKTGAKKK